MLEGVARPEFGLGGFDPFLSDPNGPQMSVLFPAAAESSPFAVNILTSVPAGAIGTGL